MATFTVTTLDDELDDIDGLGTVSIDNFGGAGDLSFREAMELVNDGVESADTVINFDPGLSGTIVLDNSLGSGGTIEIEKSVSIEGLGEGTLAIDGGGSVKLFDINGTTGVTEVAFSDITLQNGDHGTRSGGINLYQGSLTLEDVTMQDNEGARGGAIFHLGDELTIIDSTFDGNTSDLGFGGAIYADYAAYDATTTISGSSFTNNSATGSSTVNGGAIRVLGADLTITDSIFTGNDATTTGDGAANGGAIYLRGSDATVSGTVFLYNTAEALGTGATGRATGGAIHQYGGSLELNGSLVYRSLAESNNDSSGGGLFVTSGASVTVQDSTISNNYVYSDCTNYNADSTAVGGGISVLGGSSLTLVNTLVVENATDPLAYTSAGGGLYAFGGGGISIVNSTFHSNYSNMGGGIYLGFAAGVNSIDIVQSTFTGNYAITSGGGIGVRAADVGDLTLANSIVAGNQVNYGTGANIYNATSGGGNVIGTGVSGFTALVTDLSNQAVGDIFEDTVSINPGGVIFDAGELADNGGQVGTVAIDASGVAIDRGLLANLPTDDHDLDGDGNTAEVLPLDGRDLLRSVDLLAGGALPDAGAFEASGNGLQTFGKLVTGTADIGLDENSARKTQIFDVDANLNGLGRPDVGITYTLIGGNTSVDGDANLPFRINANTGVITVDDVGDHDFETTQTFALTILISIGGVVNRIVTVNVNLNDLLGQTLAGSGIDEALKGTDEQDDIDGQGGNDTLSGGDADDTVDGGEGKDVVSGGAGGDDLDGGGGTKDSLSYRGSSAGVTIDLSTNSASGGDAQGDSIQNFERLLGSDAADDLTGDASDNWIRGFLGDDTLNGGDGNDVVVGGAGADDLDGGAGTKDTLNYRGSSAAVNVNLATNTVSGGDAQGDTIQNFERAWGSAHNDTLTGDAGANRLHGFAGSDTIMGGAGNDIIDGGAGADDLDGGDGTKDTLSYRDSGSAVSIDLSTNTASGGDAQGDTIQNFERVAGSDFDDTLTGDGGDNRLLGFAGADTISGGAGADTIGGGAGVDSLTGGSGADVFVFDATDSTTGARDVITDFSGSAGDGDLLDLSTFATSFQAGGAFTGVVGETIATVGGGVTTIEVDTDGDTNADFVLTLTGEQTLTGADFVF